jgi:hypothetical protein
MLLTPASGKGHVAYRTRFPVTEPGGHEPDRSPVLVAVGAALVAAPGTAAELHKLQHGCSLVTTT